MALILRLTDGTTTLSLNDGTNYGIPDGEWTPAVSRRRRSGLAGWLYEDVEEQIPLHVRGATGAAALDNLVALVNMLDQADRFGMGEPVDPVLIQYLPHNSNLGGVVQTEVLGLMAGSNPSSWLRLSPYINDASNYELPQIQVRLLRRGDWLGDADTDSAAAVGPAEIATCTLSEDIPLYSPLTLELGGMDYSTADAGFYPAAIPSGVLLIASDATRLHLIEAEEYSASLSSAVTDVVDADASGGAYIRMTSGQSVTYTGLITNGPEGDLIGIYGMCHLTVTTDAWSIETSIFKAGSIGVDESVNTLIIDGQTDYRPARLGILARAADAYSLTITATRLSGSGDFELDVLGLLALGAPGEQAIGINGMTFFDASLASNTLAFVFEHQRLVARRPAAYTELSGGVDSAHIRYEGNIHLVSIGENVLAMWLAGGAQWRHEDDAGVVSLTMAVSRRRAYLAPR